MSFLKKAVAAAAVAKNQLDDVLEQRAAASVRPVAAAGPDDHEQRVVARARALGAPDPFSLLTAERASAAAGHELGGPALTYSDDMLGVKYEASGSGGRHFRAAVSAFHAIDEDTAFDAREHWDSYLSEMVSDGEPVGGLGDAAVARDTEVFVLSGDRLLMVEVSTPGEGDRDRAIALAHDVV